MPDRTFTVTELTGTEHMARAKPLILDWVAERARFGFFEWYSHVYMKKNIEPLATLIEHAQEAELTLAAAMALDLCLLDMAGHCHAGSYTASRGRTYAKDQTSTRESTYDMFRLVFDDSAFRFWGGPDNGANHLARATRYRPPQVLVDIALGDEPGVTRERHGIFVDGAAPMSENSIREDEPAVERDDAGFTVAWRSPTSGEISFGSTAPFVVDGVEEQIAGLPRHESKWGTVERLATTFELRSDHAALTLDFDTSTREVDAS